MAKIQGDGYSCVLPYTELYSSAVMPAILVISGHKRFC